MAATNYTPIQLYFSTTASAVPLAANLAQGELAINITDGKLYYEDNAGVVQVIATKGAGTIGGSTTQIQYNNAGALAGNAAMTFNSGTSTTTLTTLNLTNALGAIYGGTAQSTYAQGDFLYASASNTLSKLGIGANTYILTSTGSVPQWSAPSSIIVQTATNLAGGLAGSVPYQSALDTTTFLAIGAANRVMTSTGSAPQWVTSLTGLTGVSSSSITNTSLTSGRVVVSTTAGLQADDADLTFDGTTLSAGGFSTTGLSTLVKTVTVGNSSFNGTAVFAAATPAKLYMGTGTVTDVTSAISATNAVGAIASLGITPIAATNTSVTYTNASTLYIAGAPSAGTNVTITNPYSLYVAAGTSYFGGTVNFATTPVYSGGTANGVMYLDASKNITTGTALAFDGSALTLNSVSGQLNMYYPGTAANSGNPIYFSSDSGGTNSTYASFSAILESGTRKGKLYFQTSNGSTPVVRWNIDSYGALGSGQTNSAWGSPTVPIQLGASGVLYSSSSANYMNIGSNIYYNGSSNVRIVTDYVSLYSQTGGNHDWYVGGTGAAGSGITLTQTMRLANTGNLLLSGGALNDVSLLTLTGNTSITSLGYTTITQRFDTANYDAIRFQNASGSQDYMRLGYDLSAGAGSSGFARVEALGVASTVYLIANNIIGLTSDYNGNGGVRTTAYAWGTSNVGLDIGSYGGLGQITSVSSTVLTQNLYHNGSGFIAKNTGVGSYYQQYNGGHLWYYTPSVSAGATASPSLQMFLSASGQLILGTTATANGATFATAAPPNTTVGTQGAFISGAKVSYASVQSLPQGQLAVYDTTTNTAGSGGAISFIADCGSGQYTWLGAIDARRDSATAGNYGGSLNFYVRPVGGTYSSPAMSILSTGNITYLTNGSTFGQLVNDSGYVSFGVGDTGMMFIGAAQLRIIPRKPGTPASASDNAIDLGDSGSRYRVIYAGTGTINTSDANDKQDFADITEAERRAAVAVKALFKSFRFKDAVAEKGDAARIHFGVVAQEVRSAFEAEGLDAHRYGLFCSDTWYEVNGNRYMDAREVTSADAGAVERTRLGVRYDELLSFVICAI